MKKELKYYPEQTVENFINYVRKLRTEKKKGQLKNPWASRWDDSIFVALFKKVADTGMYIDGKHITINPNGVSYDYIAYKNKMLMVYPESQVDVQLVYEGDTTEFSKQSGQVVYRHILTSPFESKDEDIIGGYCVIKNKRGEFLTTISKADIEKHRGVAKQDYIWAAWYKEMALKTIIKKAVKVHFDDIYQGMEDLDNTQYDLEKSDPKELMPGTNHYEKVIATAKEEGLTLEDLKAQYEISKAASNIIKKQLQG